MDQDKRIEKMEAKRLEAFASRDAAKYSKLCAELGVEPEDSDLIERAEADVMFAKLKKEGIRREEKRSKYSRFLVDAYNCSYGSPFEDTEYKRETLAVHFPGRFGANAKQCIADYSDGMIGSLFSQMVENAEETVEKNNRN